MARAPHRASSTCTSIYSGGATFRGHPAELSHVAFAQREYERSPLSAVKSMASANCSGVIKMSQGHTNEDGKQFVGDECVV
mmetsp:Transcript_13103/g.33585  ORF Transcript_13103/g.33585 Transcript_13103/m.33585 type:complete len:81 (-) Transcript_13103:140-382(-)